MITWVLFLGIGLVVGIIAGLYFARLDDVTNKQKKVLQQKLESAEQQLKGYQSQVTEHFLKTASLVNSMTESYKAVHDHLAMGAKELCDSQINVAQLEMPTTKLLDSAAKNAATHEAVTENPAATPETQVNEIDAQVAAEQRTVGAQKPEPQDEEPAAQVHKMESAIGEEPSQGEGGVSAVQPEEQAEQPKKEEVEALQPPSTPESLHVEPNEPGASKSLKDSEQTAPASVSRMVH
ncbi:MAG: DUF1043 family protein [Gammaproteobacteria bacterium]|jgi:hypothetical protein